MRALVTGAGGFCGRHLVAHLKHLGVEVHALSERTVDNAICHTVVPTSVSQISSVLSTVRPNFVFHLAGASVVADPTILYRINTGYAAALICALEQQRYSNCPLLLVGTSAEYGMVTPRDLPIRETLPAQPYNDHGISKFAQTLMGLAAAKRGLPVVIARPFNIIGPGMPEYLVVQSFALQIKQILNGQCPPQVKVGNLQSSRDFVDVQEVVEIYWQILQIPSAYGEIINICSGQGVFIKDILETLTRLSGTDIEVQTDSARFKRIDVPLHYGSTEKLKNLLGYAPSANLEKTLWRILYESGRDEKDVNRN